jgi:hypothetical protein
LLMRSAIPGRFVPIEEKESPLVGLRQVAAA